MTTALTKPNTVNENKIEKNQQPRHPVTLEEIRVRAFQKYCARNGCPGTALEDWLQAEKELSAGK